MLFCDYIKQFNKAGKGKFEIERLSKKTKKSDSYLRGLSAGLHPMPRQNFDFAIELHQATDGKVSLKENFPDIAKFVRKINKLNIDVR